MSNPYDDNTNKKAIAIAGNYATNYEKDSAVCSFNLVLDGNITSFGRSDQVAQTIAGMYLASAVYEYSWDSNEKKIDAWMQFKTIIDMFKKAVANNEEWQYYKDSFNARIAMFIVSSKASSQTVRNSLKTASIKPEELVF